MQDSKRSFAICSLFHRWPKRWGLCCIWSEKPGFQNWKMAHGLILEYFNESLSRGKSVWTQQKQCLVFHRPFTQSYSSQNYSQKIRLNQSGVIFKACELDHGHEVPNATLKLEIVLKTQLVSKCCGCLMAVRLKSSLERFLWVTVRI